MIDVNSHESTKELYDDSNFYPFDGMVSEKKYDFSSNIYSSAPNLSSPIQPSFLENFSEGFPYDLGLNQESPFDLGTQDCFLPFGGIVNSNTGIPFADNTLDKNNTLYTIQSMPDTFDLLKDVDEDLDNNYDSRALDYIDRATFKPKDVEYILSQIENNNPAIIKTLMAYRIPYPVAKLLLRRIVKLSLTYYSNK